MRLRSPGLCSTTRTPQALLYNIESQKKSGQSKSSFASCGASSKLFSSSVAALIKSSYNRASLRPSQVGQADAEMQEREYISSCLACSKWDTIQ
jgi:hypothetical protein